MVTIVLESQEHSLLALTSIYLKKINDLELDLAALDRVRHVDDNGRRELQVDA